MQILCCSMILIMHTANKMRPVQPDCLCALVGGLLSPLTYGAGQFRRATCRRRAYLRSPFIPDGLDMISADVAVSAIKTEEWRYSSTYS